MILVLIKKMNGVDFNFSSCDLVGYWIAGEKDEQDTTKEIIVYIGGHKFVTKYKERTIEKLNKLLHEKN